MQVTLTRQGVRNLDAEMTKRHLRRQEAERKTQEAASLEHAASVCDEQCAISRSCARVHEEAAQTADRRAASNRESAARLRAEAAELLR
jgi:hypothetical protein